MMIAQNVERGVTLTGDWYGVEKGRPAAVGVRGGSRLLALHFREARRATVA